MEEAIMCHTNTSETPKYNHSDTISDKMQVEITEVVNESNDVDSVSKLHPAGISPCIYRAESLIYSTSECPESTELKQISELPLGAADGVEIQTDSPSTGTRKGKVIVIQSSAGDQENTCMTDEAILYAIAKGITNNKEAIEMAGITPDTKPEKKSRKWAKRKCIKSEREKSKGESKECWKTNDEWDENVKNNMGEVEMKECAENNGTNKEIGNIEARTYCCDMCKKVFQEYQAFTDHLVIHIDARPSCNICGKHYKNSHSLRNHMQFHNGNKKKFPCKETGCSKSFQKKQYLIVHQRVHTKERPFKCSDCEKTFSHSVTLLRHSRTHSGEKPYSCPNCGKCFAVLGQYSTHLRIHTGEKRYQCTECDKQFIASGQLTVHMRTHTREKPFKCDICTLSFSHSSTLKTHKRKHSGEKPHMCTLCSNKFTTVGQLTNHFRTHTGEKPFSCDICGKGFIQSGNLKAHKKLHFDENSKRYYIKAQLLEKSSQTIFDEITDV